MDRYVILKLATYKEDKGLEKLDDLEILGPYLNERCSAFNLMLATEETCFDYGRNHGNHVAFR